MELPDHISSAISVKVRRFFDERASGQIVLHVTKGIIRGCELHESMPNEQDQIARAKAQTGGKGW